MLIYALQMWLKCKSKILKLIKNLMKHNLSSYTSFNVRGEPIVNTPKDAFKCFMGTELDKLVIGNCYLDKIDQDIKLEKNYKNKFELD